MQLQQEKELIWSPIVANCRMNRERGLAGVNSYAQDLKFDILTYLLTKASQQETVHWLDICCGTGKALVEASIALANKKPDHHIYIEGWDLAGLFVPQPANLPTLQLVADSIHNWQPRYSYDLITCVHGLHYIGDKLGLLEKCIATLTTTGDFIANIDLNSIRKMDGTSWEKQLKQTFKAHAVQYTTRRRLLHCTGKKQLNINLRFAGADDKAGKNYTGQEAVHSYYQ